MRSHLATTTSGPSPGAPWSVARCPGHHGELLQGAFVRGSAPLLRALVTLPFPNVGAVASVRLLPGAPVVEVVPRWKQKAARAARLTLDELDLAAGCQLVLESRLPSGWGLGSSTADVVATIRAVLRAAGRRVSPALVARLAVAAEGASDSLMFSEWVTLFAQREGRILEVLGHRLPPLTVVGCNPSGAACVDTLQHPLPDYSAAELRQFRELLALLRGAVRAQSVREIGRVATASACINQRFLPTHRFAELEAIGRRHGAQGIQVSHSGTVAGLLFDACQEGVAQRVRECRAGLEAEGFPPTWRFRADTGGRSSPR